MKKWMVVALVLSLVICLSTAEGSGTIAPGRYVVGDGLEAGWYRISLGEDSLGPVQLVEGCEVVIVDGISLEPVDAVSFTANPGIYSVPGDLPVGRYKIACAEGSKWTSVAVFDDDGKYLISGNLHADEGNVIGLVELGDGYSVKVENGSAHFAPSSGGISFDR